MNCLSAEVMDYIEDFLTVEEANQLFDELMNYQELTEMFELETAMGETLSYDFGKIMFLDRELLVKGTFPKSIWGSNKEWSEQMLKLKKRIEQLVDIEFRTCVCIYYPNGNSGVDYHSDEVAFGDTRVIPSISLGEERHFCLREKTTKIITTTALKHGSLVIMKEGCQEHFEHSLPVNATYLNPRINLTFRRYGF